jgi:lipopolysaccharide biosynthesis glycosyltransferase
MISIFIGYDPREKVAFNVLAHSLYQRASCPISIIPLNLNQLGKEVYREKDPLQSTEFSFSRFIVPHLSNFEGWSIFMDSDMLACDDILNLYNCRDDKHSVMVVKHDYEMKEGTKFLGEKQTPYPKKNWSSLILFNNSKCRNLTKEYVNQASGLELHQFKWLDSDDQIGDLPKEWNYLVGHYPKKDDVSLVHYTEGGPYFKDYKNVDYADLWFREREDMLYALNPA